MYHTRDMGSDGYRIFGLSICITLYQEYSRVVSDIVSNFRNIDILCIILSNFQLSTDRVCVCRVFPRSFHYYADIDCFVLMLIQNGTETIDELYRPFIIEKSYRFHFAFIGTAAYPIENSILLRHPSLLLLACTHPQRYFLLTGKILTKMPTTSKAVPTPFPVYRYRIISRPWFCFDTHHYY